MSELNQKPTWQVGLEKRGPLSPRTGGAGSRRWGGCGENLGFKDLNLFQGLGGKDKCQEEPEGTLVCATAIELYTCPCASLSRVGKPNLSLTSPPGKSAPVVDGGLGWGEELVASQEPQGEQRPDLDPVRSGSPGARRSHLFPPGPGGAGAPQRPPFQAVPP